MNIESLNKKEIIDLCKKMGIEYKKLKKEELISKIYEIEEKEIEEAKSSGNGLDWLKNKIKYISDEYEKNLNSKIIDRKLEMEGDENSHYLIYEVLGIKNEEGKKIDLYQNIGRFLYKYAGAFVEEITTLCFKYKYPKSKKAKVSNTEGSKPKTFEIDCLVGYLS